MTTTDDFQLIEPDMQWKDEFIAFCRETQNDGREEVRSRFNEDLSDFITYIQKRNDNKAGRNLPAGWAPWTEYWLLQGNRLLGTSSLRHHLTPELEVYGGHIGYMIRPSERRKGYGIEILRLTLQKAMDMNIIDVLITCDDTNTASARIIEVNGGRLKDIVWNEGLNRFIRRYWINLTK